MRGLIALVLILIVQPGLNAQHLHEEADSLLRHIAAMPPNDTATIDLRNDYVKSALFADPKDSGLAKFAQHTLATAKKTGYNKGMMMAYERLGLIYQYTSSNPYKALEYYHQALSIAKSDPGLIVYKWSIEGNIGLIHYEQEEYEQALTCFKDILLHNKTLELTATANIANVYGAMERTDSAIYYYREALANPQTEDNPAFKANLYSNLSLMYGKSGRTKEAMASAKEGLSLTENHGIEFVRPTMYANAAMAYLGVGDDKKAAYYAQQALQLSEQQGNLFLEKTAWGTLSDVFKARGDHERALEAYLRFSSLKDTLNNQNRRVEINRSQMQFEFDKERAIARSEINRQETIRKAYLAVGGVLLLTFGAAFFFYRRRQAAMQQKKEAEFKALVSETELKALRAQMNPHFIFNSLNSIGNYILKHDNKTAYDYLARFARLMRMTLENSEHSEITLAEELRFTELYLQVESQRLPGRFSYDILIEDGLDKEHILVPPLMIQPFIENSIWHGFASLSTGGYISIEVRKDDDMLIYSVDDNGVGRSSGNTERRKKIIGGVSITESRISIFNKQRAGGGKLQIIDKPHKSGTKVEISLPLQTAF
ncbi:MAG TPA: histidine kinase [Flavitalea sp.]|nr:histidine kinase [Flavitalea sp.]